jgi:tetratricopeptide (TPR) repeat protein
MFLFYALLVCHSFFLPHGDLDRRISDYSQLITQFPDSLSLYADRGELYLQHLDFDLARSDFSFCLAKGLNNAAVLEGLSRSIVSTPTPDSALYFINLSLDKDSTSFSAIEWKAHLLFLLHSFCESASLYEHLIQLTPNPSPTLYIDVSNAWLNCSSPGSNENAVAMLKSGMAYIGSLHVLQKELIRIYIDQKDYKNALIEQTAWINRTANKSSPLLERARIYLLDGNHQSAQADLENALVELSKLPPYKQGVPAMVELKERIEYLLNQIKG